MAVVNSSDIEQVKEEYSHLKAVVISVYTICLIFTFISFAQITHDTCT